jgi:predicted alpha/beta-fold hydrolase
MCATMTGQCGTSFSRGTILSILLMTATLAGCETTHSFPMTPGALQSIDPRDLQQGGARVPAREWVRRVQPRLDGTLPESSRHALTTSALTGRDGKIVDVCSRFGLWGRNADSMVFNYPGLKMTAQAVPAEELSASDSEWAGYECIDIPTDDEITICARVAPPTGTDLGRSYVIITHGLFNKQAGIDQVNTASALRAFGHHVVAIDMRGHGKTRDKHPDAPITFGMDEGRDLIAVSRYLQERMGATRVGLLCFSFSGFEALNAAWIDGDSCACQVRQSALWRCQPKPGARPAFDGGILAISPAINLISLADQMETDFGYWGSPMRYTIQGRIRNRLRERGEPESHRMWAFIESELRRSKWMDCYTSYDELLADTIHLMDFSAGGSDWKQGAHRMEKVRVPLVVLQAADDPLPGSAQAVAEVFGRVSNPNCGTIMIRRGGHTGFAALSAPYYYSLMKAFFDPHTGPAGAINEAVANLK